MKKFLLPLLVLALLCVSMAALAENQGAITLEVKTAKLPVYAADDPYLAGFRAEAADDLPVLLLPVKKNVQLQIVQGSKETTELLRKEKLVLK